VSPAVLIVVYCVFIVAASLLGGWLPSVVRLTHTRMQILMSFVSGLMLGVALLHLLPQAIELKLPVGTAMMWMLAGLLVMFLLIRIFDFHQHGSAETEDPSVPADSEHSHDHPHHGHQLNWVGLAFGLSVHTAIDGVALGASVVAEAQNHEALLSLFGLSTFLAIVLHKPLDALSITSLMTASGWSARGRSLVNGGFALMCPLGALLFWVFSTHWAGEGTPVIACALAFSAGVFLCISLGDLLPEVHFHKHDRVKLSIALLLGVALAYAIEKLPGHHHDVDPLGSQREATDSR